MLYRPFALAYRVMLTFGMAGPAVAPDSGAQQPTAREQLQHVHTPQSIDQELADALVGVSKAELTEPLGFWGVLKIFGSKNLRRGLAVVNNLLEAWGRNFSTQ